VCGGLWLLPIHLQAAEPRQAKVAGQFYPAAPDALRSLVSHLLDRSADEPLSVGKPRILIAPHAGYGYSGSVAASAFRQIQGRSYDAVVVIGFTHRGHFPGASVDAREAYRTPLGDIPVDLEAVQFLLTNNPVLEMREEAHASPEHSLEVMLPFLQVALSEVRLVPILMGTSALADADALADALAALADRGDYLFVFSTDLSHYHPYEQANRVDERTLNAILYESPQAVDRLFERELLEACGRGPIVASLRLANRLGYLRRQLLSYANSGDTAGDRARVVGYAAVGMTERGDRAAPRLSAEAGSALVRAARQTLERVLIRDEAPAAIDLKQHPELAQAHGVFVTLRRKDSGLLCGCIGRVQTDEPLANSVPLVALDAALRDPRFPPLRGEELKTIQIEVSVLTPPRRIGDVDEIVPDRDGVVLEHAGRRGVFLPSVWRSTGWTRKEFLRELASQKAGLEPGAWREASLYVFQDQVFEEPASGAPIAH